MNTLCIQNITKKIHSNLSLDNISINLNKNQIIGLFGPNGSGKSSLFNIVTGLDKQDSGHITLHLDDNEQSIDRLSLHERAQKGIGYLPQENTLFLTLNVYENLQAAYEIAFPNHDRSQQERAIESVISEFQLDGVTTRTTRLLSGGEKRRVELARIVLLEPAFILLDEPFAGIDPISIEQIKTFIIKASQKSGILITDHQVITTLDICDEGVILYKGKMICSGSPQDIVAHQKVQSVYLGKHAILNSSKVD